MGHTVSTESSAPVSASPRKRQALDLFSGLPRHYDTVGAVMSFGQDPRWRSALVDAASPAAGDRVLDVATGTGMVAALLRSRADCAVVGLDQSDAMLARARERFAGDTDVELVRGEAECLPFPDGEFDALTFTYLLRYVDDPAATLCELARVVRPGGRIASLEFGVPGASVARALWYAYTRAGLPVIGRLVSRDWRRVGAFLGSSIDGFYRDHPLERIVGYWRAAGIDDVRVNRMSFGAGVVISGVRADARSAAAPQAVADTASEPFPDAARDAPSDAAVDVG